MSTREEWIDRVACGIVFGDDVQPLVFRQCLAAAWDAGQTSPEVMAMKHMLTRIHIKRIHDGLDDDLYDEMKEVIAAFDDATSGERGE